MNRMIKENEENASFRSANDKLDGALLGTTSFGIRQPFVIRHSGFGITPTAPFRTTLEGKFAPSFAVPVGTTAREER